MSERCCCSLGHCKSLSPWQRLHRALPHPPIRCPLRNRPIWNSQRHARGPGPYQERCVRHTCTVYGLSACARFICDCPREITFQHSMASNASLMSSKWKAGRVAMSISSKSSMIRDKSPSAQSSTMSSSSIKSAKPNAYPRCSRTLRLELTTRFSL
jgi:hypothetical protein